MSATDEEVKERTDFLLEHMRTCGVFKCFECIYCKREETHLGAMFKCVHDGVLVHCGMKDEQDLMRGCACKSRCNDGEIDECWMLAEIREIASELGMVVD